MESLYVCLFSNGHIKVGRSINPEARIASHVDRVACLGVELTECSHHECAGDPVPRERWLLDLCAERAHAQFQNEWFSGLEFNTVRGWAAQAALLDVPEPYREIGFGARLREARIAAGLSQAQLGKGIGTSGSDVNKAAISNWENDRCSPNVNQLRIACQRLGVSADSLVFGSPA